MSMMDTADTEQTFPPASRAVTPISEEKAEEKKHQHSHVWAESSATDVLLSSSATLPHPQADEATIVAQYVTQPRLKHVRQLALHFHRSPLSTLLHASLTPAGSEGTSAIPMHQQITRVDWQRQLAILSRRAVTNLWRSPSLIIGHLTVSLGLGVICGTLFWGVTSDLAGFQNRIGLFFFLLALHSFTSISALDAFSSERLIFIKERSNGFYNASAYYVSKQLLDTLLLRLLPPLICGTILYPMAGLKSTFTAFARFILLLIGFNLLSSQVWLLIGITLGQKRGLAALSGTLIMLFCMVFGGFLLNQGDWLVVSEGSTETD